MWYKGFGTFLCAAVIAWFQANKKDGYRDREEDKQTKSERDSDTKGET